MNAAIRILRFVAFTLTEYTRSGRILVEVLASIAAFYLFFRAWTSSMRPDYFFSTAGLLMVVLTFYTTSAMMGLGDRPQGYLIIARRLGRAGYLIGLYLAALVVECSVYGLLSLGVALVNPIEGLGGFGWLLGTVPLVLNAALLGALLTLLAPIVLPTGWRLVVLAIVAIAFSGNLVGGEALASLWAPIRVGLNVLRTIFSTPLLPAFTGYSLSVTRDYSGFNVAIPFAQLSLTLSLLALALYAFARRELTFSSN